MKYTALVKIAVFVLVASPALVRALPTELAAQPGDATAVATQPAPAAQPTGEATTPEFTFGVAAADLSVNGNEKRYLQYVTPPQGWYLAQLHALSYSPNGQSLFDLNVQNISTKAASGSLWLSAGSGAAVLTGRQRTSEFFRDFTPDDQAFKRNDGTYALTVPSGTGQLSMSYDSVSLQQNGASPEESWLRSDPGIGYTSRVGDWLAGAGVDRESFNFNTGAAFSGRTDTLRFAFAAPHSDRLSLEANGALLQTSFDGLTTSQHANQASVRASDLLSSNWALTGELRRDEITSTIIRNAYAKRDTGGDLTAEYRGLPGTVIEVGGGRHRIDYVDGLQNAIIPTDESNAFGKATARLTRELKLRAGYQQTWTDNAPISFDLLGSPLPSLVWSQRKDMQAELTYTPIWRMGVTGRLRKASWRNGAQGTSNQMLENSLFGWWMASSKLTLYASLLHQNFDLFNVETNPEQYVTDQDIRVYGASYQANRRILLDTAVTDSGTRGATQISQRNLWFGVHYTLPQGAILSVGSSFGDFDTAESLPLLNNSHRWVSLSLTNMFF